AQHFRPAAGPGGGALCRDVLARRAGAHARAPRRDRGRGLGGNDAAGRGRPAAGVAPDAGVDMNPPAPSPRRPRANLAATLLLAVMVGMLGVTWATQHAFQELLRPELQRKAGVVGGSVGELVGKALDHGLALDELAGVRAHLDAVRRE